MKTLTALEQRQLNFPHSGRIRPTRKRTWRDPASHAPAKSTQRKITVDRFGTWRDMYRKHIKTVNNIGGSK